MINLLNLDQLAHKARIEDNELALIILDKMEEEIENAVEEATAKNDADYSYEIFDAVQTIESLAFAEKMGNNGGFYKVQLIDENGVIVSEWKA